MNYFNLSALQQCNPNPNPQVQSCKCAGIYRTEHTLHHNIWLNLCFIYPHTIDTRRDPKHIYHPTIIPQWCVSYPQTPSISHPVTSVVLNGHFLLAISLKRQNCLWLSFSEYLWTTKGGGHKKYGNK